MLTGKKATLHAHSSLLLLQEALSAAVTDVPARPVLASADVNEQRAAHLIMSLRTAYQKPHLFSSLHDIPSPQGVPMTLPALVNG